MKSEKKREIKRILEVEEAVVGSEEGRRSIPSTFAVALITCAGRMCQLQPEHVAP